MANYPPRSEVRLRKKQLASKKQEETEFETLDVDYQDVLNLPSRKEVHQSKGEFSGKTRKENKNDKKKKQVQFPLVRILLILFLLLVAAVVTYPIWVEKLIG
ncbi:hypothetical protein J2S74_005136 [Evansella vedderi]|uniref:Uncharacterized protein n=1 Tax=Evansella vedderi TaxID=38282 RepID=A0ABU0A2F3_9BACI|nr:hypothetical protein [Evansella vedderi]MDQ0257674.1 hypothetical protein [Evansella vedderi]